MTTVMLDAASIEVIEIQAQGPMGAAGPAGPQGPQGLSGTSVAAYPAAVSVGGHLAITLDSLGKITPADASIAAHRLVAGVTTGAAVADASVEVVSTGIVEHLGWAFTPGLPVFLGLAGAIVQTVPPTAVFSKVLGVAVTPTRISLDFQPAIFI